ncbi:retrovirus-related pol polyprotein from transposon TNT 1-94 [Tanacetum coccineum]
MALTAYTDADHAGCQDTRRSTSGSAQFLGDKLVSWSSKKQKSTAILTTEDEYIAMSRCYTMADVNVNAPAEQAPAMAPPTRTDDQILPRSSWVPVGKSNCYLDVEKSQSNPIYKIAVDILKHTNFFRAFTASSTIPSIYIQQFWDTIRYDKTTGRYSCQLDEQWFDLNKDTLRDALQITPVNNNQSFSSPPTPDALINFVNDLGYPKVVRTLSAVGLRGQELQCYRFFGASSIEAILIMQRGCGKNSPNPSILYIRFTKLIIHHLQSRHKFHPRPGSPLYLPYEEYVLGYLKFSAKVTKREVFGMPILNDLITTNIRDGQYYNEYLEKVAKHQRYLAGEEGSDLDSLIPKLVKATKPEATKKSKPSAPKASPVIKPAAAKASKSTSSQQHKPKPAKPQPTSSLRLVDERIPKNEPRFDDEEADMQRAMEESLKDVHVAPRGPLPPVVFTEPDFGRRQPLPEVAFCLLEDLTAFCLKISLRFASRPHCVLLQDLTAFCFKTSLRFASRPHCVLLQDIHCVLLEDLTAFCLKTSLRFASRPHCVLLQAITAFCFNITAFCSRPPLRFA